MFPSIIMNAAIVLLFSVCAVYALFKTQGKAFFRYFTTLSNMLCAASAIAVLLFAGRELPLWVVIFKYAGTAAVSVTMLTVIVFLGPFINDWKSLLSGIALILHLICPLLAIVSFVLFEKTALPAWTIAVGCAPVLIYGIVYGIMVLAVPEKRRWRDFYGFNKNGRWKVSFLLMMLGAAAVAFVLWIV